MNISERATAELKKQVKDRDYQLIELDRERWHKASLWIRTKPRVEIRDLLSKMDDDEKEDMRRRLNVVAGFAK